MSIAASTEKMLRDTALLRLRLVALDMAELRVGLLKVGGGKFDTLAARLAEWSSACADVERTLRAHPEQQAVPDPGQRTLPL